MQIMRLVKIGDVDCPTMQSDKIEIMTSVEYIYQLSICLETRNDSCTIDTKRITC